MVNSPSEEKMDSSNPEACSLVENDVFDEWGCTSNFTWNCLKNVLLLLFAIKQTTENPRESFQTSEIGRKEEEDSEKSLNMDKAGGNFHILLRPIIFSSGFL